MRRTITLFLALSMFLALSACGMPSACRLTESTAGPNQTEFSAFKQESYVPICLGSEARGVLANLDKSTTSTTGVELEYPKAKEYFKEPFTAYVKAPKGDSIYLMPKPQSGNGNLGWVGDGKEVTILARRGAYYFFETANGRQGWNGKKYFTLDTAGKTSASSSPVSSGNSKTSATNQKTGVGGYNGDGTYYYVLVDTNRLDSDTLTLYFFGEPKSPEKWYGENIESAVVMFGPGDNENDWITGWFNSLEATNDDRFWVSYLPFDSNQFELESMGKDWKIRFADCRNFDISPKCKWVNHSVEYDGPGPITREFAVRWSNTLSTCYMIDVVIKNGEIVEIGIPYFA